MIVYIPRECSKEFEKIYCKAVEVKQTFCQHGYNNVSFIKIRRYNKFTPKIMIYIEFMDGYSLFQYNVKELITYDHRIVTTEKNGCCFY